MKISYDPAVDALYVRLVEEQVECEVIRLNNRVAVNIGPEERVVGIEVLDASEALGDLTDTMPECCYEGDHRFAQEGFNTLL